MLSRLFSLILMCLLCVACDKDDDPGNTNDTSTTNDVPSDGTTDSTAGDSMPDMGIDVDKGPLCEPLVSTDPETATYDVFLDAGNSGYYGSAEATRTGLEVSVVVDTDTFAGTFTAGSNCVPPQPGLLFPLCFLNADGSPAAPETLGATIITGPNGTIGIIAAHRRDVDRKCTVSGAYTLTLSNINVTPSDAEQTRVDALAADLGGQLMVFILPDSKPVPQTVAAMGVELPRLFNPFALEGNTFTELSRDVLTELETGVEYSVTLSGRNGTFDPAAGTVTFELEIDAEGIGLTNTGEMINITANASGTRF